MLRQVTAATALTGFDDLGRSMTPVFLFPETDFIYSYSTLSKNEQKNHGGK